MAKKTKVDKEVRKIMEAVSDLVKKKGDRYKFKSKNKKKVKKVKENCIHWIMRKHKEFPLVVVDSNRPSYWRCSLCKTSFPIKPDKLDAYIVSTNKELEYVNQIMFWAVKLGGDADDTRMFLRLKKDLERFKKVSKQVLKQLDKRAAIEQNRGKTDALSQFDAYSGFNYKP